MRAGLRGGLKPLAACLFFLGFAGAPSPGAERASPDASFVSLTAEFTRFHDETAQLAVADRVQRFRMRFDALLPGFYAPRYGRTDAAYDAQVAWALADFASVRSRYEAMAARLPGELTSGIARFRRTFPDFAPDIPIYLVHSLGEMDGGTRVLMGRTVMIFGADRIARLHADASLGPFIDHELFHIHHARFYRDCPRIRCSLWEEGLATYAAANMNRTTDPHLLMLDAPRPIRPVVDAHLAEALCLVRSKIDSTAQADRQLIFYGGDRAPGDRFPKRFGYYVGYLVAREAAQTMPLDKLSRLSRTRAAPMIDRALDRLIARASGCPAAGSSPAA